MDGFFQDFPRFLSSLVREIDDAARGFWTDTLHLPAERWYDFVLTLFIVLAYLVLRRYVVTPVSRAFRAPTRRYSFRKVGNGVLATIAVCLAAVVWIDTGGQDVFTLLGIIGAGLAVAMQDVILNFLGWLFIHVREPFSVKDRIQIGDGVKGDVVDVRLFMFSLLEVGNWVDAEQSTGRIVHVPNSVVFRQAIANYTQGFQYIWNEIPVTVTFESDWEKAHRILTEIVERNTKDAADAAASAVQETSTRFMVYYTRFTPIVWVAVADIGVTLTMRYLCDVRRRRSTAHAIWTEVLRAFAAEPTIDFAYPTTRFYTNATEGKPGTGGPPRLSPDPEVADRRPRVDTAQPQEAETGEILLEDLPPRPPPDA